MINKTINYVTQFKIFALNEGHSFYLVRSAAHIPFVLMNIVGFTLSGCSVSGKAFTYVP